MTTKLDPIVQDPRGADASDGLLWPHPLHPFQLHGVARLVSSESALLADEMGLGKTIQAIAALRLLFARGKIHSALVVAPAALLLQWRKEFRDWAPELDLATAIGLRHERILRWRSSAHVYIVSYEVLLNDRLMPKPFGPAHRVWDVVVADEAQRIKNEHTEASAALKALQRRRAWALTGTPLENCVDDLGSIIDFVAPGRLDRREMMFGLRRVLSDVQLRRRRREALPDLPPKTGATVTLVLGPEQRASYDRAEEDGRVWLRSLGRDVAISHVLELILRLKQICNACPKTDQSVKRDDLLMRLTPVIAAAEKALIFSQFVAEPFGIEMLARHLADFRPLIVAGGQSVAEREHALAAFTRDDTRRLMLLSLRAGGVGLNLTAASTVFHFDRWWNPAVEAQAEDRTHRIGQTRPVTTFAYLCRETIEERIRDIIEEKMALFAETVDSLSVRSLSRLDLKTLLGAVGV